MRDRTPTRRDLLRLFGVGAVGSLAGCPGEDRTRRTLTPLRVPTETAPVRTPTDGLDSIALETTLTAADGDSADEFGEAIAVSDDGSIAVVGAPADEDPHGELAGSAYVFDSAGGTWTQVAKLVPEDGASFDGFGGAVAVSAAGTTALVGAPDDENANGNGAGGAYVFDGRDTWHQRAKLTPTDGDRGDAFGQSVALSGSGTTAVLGAPEDEDPNGSLGGSAYVFELTDGSWTQQAKLAADDGDTFDSFGGSVTVSDDGETVVVGAHADEDPHGELAGSAYVFEATDGGWVQRTKLTPDDGDRLDRFGWAVDLSGEGTTALVSAYSAGAGSVSVVELIDGSWSQQATLAAPDGDDGDFFGFAVALVGADRAVVGAPGDEGPTGGGVGSAYLFERDAGEWTGTAKFTAAAGDAGDFLGRGVGVSGAGDVIVGAPFDTTDDGDSAGSASVFMPAWSE